MSDFSLRAALCFDNEQGGLRCTRPCCYDARRRVGRCIWRGGSRPSLAPMTKRKGRSPVAWELRPYERSRRDRARGSPWHASRRVVPVPPGVVMVAPPEVPRNAEGAQCEGRVVLPRPG
jgi:hypothetical protein